MSSLKQNFNHVISTISTTAKDAGVTANSIALVAVSKQQPTNKIVELAALGQQHFGENYVQEALQKINALNHLNLTWHFIGALQSNKTRTIAEKFSWCHTVDSFNIALRLNNQRPTTMPPLNICIQVNINQEPQKAGVAVNKIKELAVFIQPLPHLKLRGLMCIPAATADEAQLQQSFASMQQAFNELNAAGFALDTLSMGMSHDFTTAIKAGSNMVRIGTAIFGPRM